MDIFTGYSPDQLALIDQLRHAAREKALANQAADVAAESVRRLNALGFWRRLYVNTATRWWSTVAVLLYRMSKWIPGVHGAALSAAGRVLQPPALYPEVRAEPNAPLSPPALNDRERKAAAFQAFSCTA